MPRTQHAQSVRETGEGVRWEESQVWSAQRNAGRGDESRRPVCSQAQLASDVRG